MGHINGEGGLPEWTVGSLVIRLYSVPASPFRIPPELPTFHRALPAAHCFASTFLFGEGKGHDFEKEKKKDEFEKKGEDAGVEEEGGANILSSLKE